MLGKHSKRIAPWLYVATFYLAALSNTPLLAAIYNWDTLPATNVAGDSIITGGSGTWNTTLNNWTINSGTSPTTWINGSNEAIFGGNPGTVTLGTSITANKLSFNSSGYVLAGNSSLSMTGTTPTISVPGSGDVMTMTMPLSGGTGLTIDGNGTVRAFNSSFSLGGNITVNAGSTFHWLVSSTSLNNFAGSGTVLLQSNNTGSSEGVIARISSGINSFTGKYLIKNATFDIDSDNISAASVEVIGHSQVLYNSSGNYGANITLNSIGLIDPVGSNKGSLRLEFGSPVLTGTITLARDSRITSSGTNPTISGTIQEVGGPQQLEIGGSNDAHSLLLKGTTTHTGGTVVSGRTVSTSLILDYSANNNSKFNDSSRLIFNGRTFLNLTGSSGNHTEVVGEFANRGGLTISRSGVNTAKIALGDMVNPGMLNVLANNLATTTTANNALGYLPGVVFNTSSLASKDAGGNIIAAPVTYTTFSNLSSTAQTLPSAPNSLVRITGVSGSFGLLRPNTSSPGITTEIGSLLFAAPEAAATIDMTSFRILRFANEGEIISSSLQQLSITSGIITAGGPNNDTPGTLRIHGNLTPINISTAINNNGTGAVTVVTGGDVYLNNSNNQFTGGLTISGTVTFLQNGSLGGTGNIVTLDGGTLVIPSSSGTITKEFVITANGGELISSSTTARVDGAISGPGKLSIFGFGSTQIRGMNSYTGGTLIVGNQVTVDANTAALGTGPITVRGSTSSGAALITSGGVWANDFFISGRTNSPEGVLRLNNTTLTGAITLESDSTISGPFTGTSTIHGAISGPYGLTLSGSGRLTLTGANTYSGPTTIGGTVAISGAGSLLNGDYYEAISNLGTLIYESSANQILRGPISGSGFLTKAGNSTLALLGANTYTGDTTINAGKLLINGNNSSTLGDCIVNGGTLGGTGTFAGTVTVMANATLSPGASIESFTTGAVTFQTGSIFEYEFSSDTLLTGDLLKVNGTVSLNNATLDLNDLAATSTFIPYGTKLTLINASALGGTFANLPNGSYIYAGSNWWQINYLTSTGGSNFASEQTLSRYVTLTTTAIPEPSTLVLGGISLLVIAGLEYRRRQSAKL